LTPDEAAEVLAGAFGELFDVTLLPGGAATGPSGVVGEGDVTLRLSPADSPYPPNGRPGSTGGGADSVPPRPVVLPLPSRPPALPEGERPDLVVVAADSFDFLARGGAAVERAARLAEANLAPAVVLAGRVEVSTREMRTFGIESAHVVPASAPARQALRQTAVRIARGWAVGV
jgi:hypothetical protein